MARTTPPAGSRKGRAGLRRSLLVALLAACAVIGALIAPAGVRASTAAQLQRLARLDAAQVEAVVRADPAQLLELANANPEETAREWPRLPKGDRAQLERLLPGFVGNFDGVPYATRDRANKRLLQQRLSSAQATVVSRPSDTGNVLALAAYKAIRAAVTVKSRPARHLVEFVPGVRPAAGRHRCRPRRVRRYGRSPADRGDPGSACRAGGPASRPECGGALLRDDDGRRRAGRQPLGIGTVVLLGSAGIEETIRDAGALHADAVYAGEAIADEEAALGRFSRVDPRQPG